MQAITVAISSAGVEFFTQSVLQPQLTSDLGKLTPQGQTINLGSFIYYYTSYENVVVQLTGQSVSNFNPQFQNVTQGTNGAFTLAMSAANFNANYDWHESGDSQLITDSGPQDEPFDNHFPYSPTITSMGLTLNLAFQYQSNAWQITATASQPTVDVPPQVPDKSITKDLIGGCMKVQAGTAVENAVQSVDFAGSLNQVIPPLLDSIPASGNLTPDIVFTFGLGDSGLTFPNNSGIGIGATGQSTWKGQAYPGIVPPALPVPLPPTDGHHLQMYVGEYALNGLYWAFFNDGQLTSTIQPSDPNFSVALKVATYTSLLPALKPYATRAMQAQIQPLHAPTVTFQTVYVLTTAVMSLLQTQLPLSDYNNLIGLSGNAYTTQTALDSDLTAAGITTSASVATIETAAKATGAVNTHDLQFTFTILDEPDPVPYFEFSVNRIDILQNLGLGTSGTAQTLTFAFTPSQDTETFIKSNIPGLNAQTLGPTMWQVVGEQRYDQLLSALGQKGVPLPIMQGFTFDFTEAVLNLEEGFVSILANVQFTS